MASAITLDDCEDMGTATAFTYDFSKTCYKGTFGTTANQLDITMIATSEMAASADAWDVIMWNAAQSTSFAATATYVNTRGTSSGVAATVACINTACSATGTFVHRVSVNPPAAGEHHFNVTSGVGAWGFVVVTPSTAQPVANADTATGKRVWVEVLAATGAGTLSAALTGGFVSARIIVRDANFTFEPVSSSDAAQPTGANLGLPGLTASTRLVRTGTVTTANFHRTGRPAATGNEVEFTMPSISTTYFDWGAQKTPFVQGYITFDSDNVATYPLLSASVAKTMTLGTPSTGISGLNNDDDIVELDLDLLWWNFTIDAPTLATVGADAAYKTGYATVQIVTNPSTSSFTAAGTLTGTASNFHVTNAAFAIGDPTTSLFNELAPAIYETAPRVFARITRNTGTQPTSALLTSTVSLRTETVVGSCRSYADCYAADADHPALRSRLSAGLTASRLRKCVLMPSAGNPIRPVSQCSECRESCDCGEGEYCHLDTGVCQGMSGTYYTCDSTSHSKYGLCVAKDPTNKIIGAGCRTNAGAVFNAGLSAIGSGASLGIFKNRLDNGSTLTATQSGSGFCGGVVYYNASNTDGQTATGVSRNSSARSVLWTGSCLDGVCHECTTATSSCGNARTCIQGRLLDTIVVDSTVRTFTSNTVAGTMLGATMMIILAIIIVMADCVCRHQWREQDVKQRKLNEQRRKSHHDAKHESLKHEDSATAQTD